MAPRKKAAPTVSDGEAMDDFRDRYLTPGNEELVFPDAPKDKRTGKRKKAEAAQEEEQLAEASRELPVDDGSQKNTLHSGHRDRLRTRFIEEQGLDSFQDHEVLELLLYYAIPRQDTNPIAHRLLDSFGDLKSVLEARPEQLMTVRGVGKEAATLISMAVPLTKIWQRCAMTQLDRITNIREAEKYCRSLLLGNRVEHFYVISLNAQCQVLGKRLISEGSLSEVSAYPRLVMETALNYNAHSVMLCHNHPGGTCVPSPEDLKSTMQLQRLLSGVGITLLDHIIVAGNMTYSMIQHGDIDYRIGSK